MSSRTPLTRQPAHRMPGGDSRAFTVLEFIVAMTLTLAVVVGSSLALGNAMTGLREGQAREGALELAYQVLAKERVYECGLGVGEPDPAREQLCGRLLAGLDSEQDAAVALPASARTETDSALRCDGDSARPGMDVPGGGCFQMQRAGRTFRVYTRSTWRHPATQAGRCTPTDQSEQPTLLLREVTVAWDRAGVWDPGNEIVVSGAVSRPDRVEFLNASAVSFAGRTAPNVPVRLTVQQPAGAATALTRWSDEAGCVWFPYLPRTEGTSVSAQLATGGAVPGWGALGLLPGTGMWAGPVTGTVTP